MHRQFKRILNLVRRTGDRMVVTDPEGEEAYVVMGLEQYEELWEAADQRHANKEGLDEEEDDDWSPDFAEASPFAEASGDRSSGRPDWKPEDYGDLVHLETPEDVPPGDNQGTRVQAPPEDLPSDLKEAVEHDLAILEAWRKETENAAGVGSKESSQSEPKNDDEEERFYLEPIE